ncbi:MAG: DUF448 domain-containing protein [Mariprofundaceae bacterium]
MKSNSDAVSDTAPGIAPESKRKLNQRQCLICRNRAEKNTMLRLVVDDEDQVWPDLHQKAPGRGTYLCMQKACLENLSDKRLGALRRDFNVQLPQSSKLIERMRGGLHQQLMRLFSQYRAVAVVGRDAVMHQMWKDRPLLILLAVNAGDALVRQINDAVEKRREAGKKTVVLDGFSVSFLAEAFARDKISVAALDIRHSSAKLYQFCVWYERACELKLS